MKILNLDPKNYSLEAEKILTTLGDYETKDISRDHLKKIINKYEVLIIRFSHLLDKEMLKGAERLKYICCNATGIDHIDEDFAKEKKIKIISLKGEFNYLKNITASAEHTWGLILALFRRLPNAFEDVKNHNWNRNHFIGEQLFKKNIGIYGLGRNGKLVAKYAHAFGMNIIGFDINVDKSKIPSYIKMVNSEKELLSSSNIISLHIPLNKNTKHIIDKTKIKLMPNECYLINTSRGELINEKDLISAIYKKKFSGVALDVMCNEVNLKKSNLSKLLQLEKTNNIIITPHIAGVTIDSWQQTEIFVANKLRKILKNDNKK
jgi:D-3-phosphoglycerate dehydrogenase